MIEYKKGDLLAVTSGFILHGCNALGVMGSGVAKAIRAKYPNVYESYRSVYEMGGLQLGYVDWAAAAPGLFIANCITQENFGRDGKRYVNYSALARCFHEVVTDALEHKQKFPKVDTTLHFPKIGAGLGGGDWAIIEQLINDSDPTDSVRKICWEL